MKTMIYAFFFFVAFFHSVAGSAQSYYETRKAQAARGDSGAQYGLGVIYEHGMGVPQNFQEAVRWYGFAAEQQHSRAQFNLGVMYATGRGVLQDFSEAVTLYRLAACQGLVDAQYTLGLMYANSNEVAQNYEQAFIWFSIVADQESGGFWRRMVSDAVTMRDRLTQQLTPQALLQAQEIATRCFESNLKDCDLTCF